MRQYQETWGGSCCCEEGWPHGNDWSQVTAGQTDSGPPHTRVHSKKAGLEEQESAERQDSFTFSSAFCLTRTLFIFFKVKSFTHLTTRRPAFMWRLSHFGASSALKLLRCSVTLPGEVCVAFFCNSSCSLHTIYWAGRRVAFFFSPHFFLTFLFCVIQLSHCVGLIISSSGQAWAGE